MKILLINIGNTCTSVAVATGPAKVTMIQRKTGGFADRPLPLRQWRRAHGVDDAVLCSVVPSQTKAWLPALRKEFGHEPLTIAAGLRLGVRLDYPRPGTIGADRLADVCAGVWLHGSPVLVVDIGTAATLNLVESGNRFVGGAIAPGPALFTTYMSERTAQLPLVEFPSGRLPRIGRNTRQSMRLAAGVGYRGMMDALVAHILDGLPGRVPVVYTGGNAAKVVGGREGRRVDPLLTLRGLACAWELNRGSRFRNGE